MDFEFVLFVSVLLFAVHGAFVQPFQCGSLEAPKPLSSTLADLTVEALLKENFLLYRLQFTLNETVTSAAAIGVSTNFIGDEVHNVAALLCDYATVVQDSVFGGPPGGPPGGLMEPRNDTFTGDNSLQALANLISNRSGEDDSGNVAWIAGYNFTRTSTTSQIQCPLEPLARYQLAYVDEVDSNRYFGSYDTFFSFSDESSNIGCFEAVATPYHPRHITYPICFGIMAIFVFGLLSTFYIYHYSPNQESSNVFLLTASSICNEPLLNELTPDVVSLLNYLQFALLSVCLDLPYPWFLLAILSFTNWVALIRIDVFSSTFINPLSADGVYQTLGRFGLLSIFPLENRQPGGKAVSQIWENFMIWLSCSIAFFAVLSQLTIFFSRRCTFKNYPWSKSFNSALGVCVQFCYLFFPLPFISISSFLFWALVTHETDVSIVAAVLSIFFMVIWIAVILWFFFNNVWRQKDKLYSSLKIITIWGPVYNYYKPHLVWFVLLDKSKIFVDGLIIGLAPRNGIFQIVALLVLNIAYAFVTLYYLPFFNKRKNIWAVSLTLLQIVSLMLSITYIRDLNIKTTTRSIIGDVQLTIHCCVVVTFLFFFVLRSYKVYRSRKKHHTVSVKKSRTYGEHYDEDQDEINFDNQDSEPDLDPISRLITSKSEVTADIQLTDSRALPGLSLSYMSHKNEEQIPTAISPITYEYLERIAREDIEVKALWKNRLVKRRGLLNDSGSWITRLQRSSNDSDKDKGLKVLGRKSILSTFNEVEGKVIKGQVSENDNKDTQRKTKPRFEVIRRKPVTVNNELPTTY